MRSSHHESHADLIHGDECRIGGKLACHPRKFDQTGDDIGQRRHQREQGVLAGNAVDHAGCNRAAEYRKRTRQRQFQLRMFAHDGRQHRRRISRFKQVAIARHRYTRLTQNDVKVGGGFFDRVDGVESPQAGSVVEPGRHQKIFHRFTHGRVRCRQPNIQRPFRGRQNIGGAQARDDLAQILQNTECHLACCSILALEE